MDNGYVFLKGTSAISFRSQRHQTTALLFTEAENVSLAEAMK